MHQKHLTSGRNEIFEAKLLSYTGQIFNKNKNRQILVKLSLSQWKRSFNFFVNKKLVMHPIASFLLMYAY